jgi:iron complex transport system permease protein
MNPRRRTATIFAVLVVVLVMAIIAASALGTVFIPFGDILGMTLNKLPFIHLEVTWSSNSELIIFQVRLLRVLGAALCGSALAVAGVLFQGLLRNPLADPYIMGTSSGSLLGVALGISFIPVTLSLWGFGIMSLAAFVGALGAVFLVYLVSRGRAAAGVTTLILVGFAVGAFFTAMTWFLLSTSGQYEHKLGVIFDFLVGAIRLDSWLQFSIVVIFITGGIIGARFFTHSLNALALGEEGAAYVGVTTERAKIAILSLGAFLTAAAVSIGGLIGFVGLVIPHVMRLVLGPDHRLLIPASALAGASFLVLADLGARVILAPSELRLGVLTALVGAPFFIYLIRRRGRGYAF